MTPPTTRNDIERRLRSTFHAKADRLVVRDFDLDVDLRVANESTLPTMESEPLARRHRPRGRALMAAAAIVVVLATVGVITQAGWFSSANDRHVVRTRPSDDTYVPPITYPGSAPPLAPTVIPDGMQLWSHSTSTGIGTPMQTSQLFGAVDASGALAPGLLIEMQAAPPGEVIRPGGPADATVRGHTVTVDGAKDAGQGTSEFAWVEGDAEVRVTVRGTTVAHAVEILDALKPRGASTLDGFDPASAPAGTSQLGEVLRGSDPTVTQTFAYGTNAPSLGGSADLGVWTATGAAYPGFLRTWMAGSRSGDGPAVEFDPGVGVIVAWPDGRQAVAASSGVVGRDELERVARSVTVLDGAAAANLGTDLTHRFTALPVVGSGASPAGRFELHGNEGKTTAICFFADQNPTCAGPIFPEYSTTAAEGIAGSVSHNGEWLVFATATTTPSVTNGFGAGPLGEPTVVLRASVAGVETVIAKVANGVDSVTVSDTAGRAIALHRSDASSSP